MCITQKNIQRTIFKSFTNRMNVIVLVLIIFIYNSVLVFGLNKPCPSVTLRNGSVRYRSKGRIAKFRCNRGFILNGENIAACIRGVWDVDVPRCVFRSSCRAITEIPNGHVLGNKRWTSLRFICNNGYHLVGRSQLQCTNSKWDGEPPQCLTSVQLSCDFESNGICGWDNSTRSGYFWLKRQFATPSHYLDTGPGRDHTLQPKNNGHYLYIETSGLSSIKTPTARLHSPLFPPVENNDTCFTFWYHMFGATIGDLIVYIDGHKVFHKSGNQGNRWIKGVVKNLPTDTFFQISIEGTAGSGWTGDIAIDDLNITSSSECTRPDLEDTTCDGRCYEDEVKNSTLCECNQECIAKSTCCSDFFDVCNADISSTGLPYSTLISQDEITMIANEDQPGSTMAYESSSGLGYINTIAINYSNKPITEHSKKSKTTDNEIEFSTNYYTSDIIKTNITSSASMTTVQDKDARFQDTTHTTSVNEELNSKENHSNSFESTIYKYPFVSQVPTHFYTSDLALDYSDSDSEKDNKNNRTKEFLKENKYSDAETIMTASVSTAGSTVGTTVFSSNSRFISSVPENSMGFANVSTIESNSTSQPNKTVLISNISLKTVAPHTHLHRNGNSSHLTIQLIHLNNNFTSIHLPVTTTDLYRNEKSIQPNLLTQVTGSFLSTHSSLGTINLSGDKSSNQVTQKPYVRDSDESTYIKLGTTNIYRYEDSSQATQKTVRIYTYKGSSQATQKPYVRGSDASTYIPLGTSNRYEVSSQTTQKPEVNDTSATTYLPNVRTAVHTNKNISRATYKPVQSSIVTTLSPRRENSFREKTHLPHVNYSFVSPNVTLNLYRTEKNSLTTHSFHVNHTFPSTAVLPIVTTAVHTNKNISRATHKPVQSSIVTTLSSRRENSFRVKTHLPHVNYSFVSPNVTLNLYRTEKNSLTTHSFHVNHTFPSTTVLPIVTTAVHTNKNISRATHKPVQSSIVTTLSPRRENSFRVKTHLPHVNYSFVSPNVTLNLYRTEKNSLTTHSFHVNHTFPSSTDLPIATNKFNVTITHKILHTVTPKKVGQSQTIFPTRESTTETLPVNVQIQLARTERTRWKSVYRPKGYYTYSARNQEQTNSSKYKNIVIILGTSTIFIIGATIGIYIYRRRSFLNGGYNVEEADVLFIPNDELLDFSVASPQSRRNRKNYVNKVLL